MTTLRMWWKLILINTETNWTVISAFQPVILAIPHLGLQSRETIQVHSVWARAPIMAWFTLVKTSKC